MNKWKQHINIKQHLNEGETLEQIIQAAKGIHCELKKLKVQEGDYQIEEVIEFFEDVAYHSSSDEDVFDLCNEFNYRLHDLYDWADGERVWLGL